MLYVVTYQKPGSFTSELLEVAHRFENFFVPTWHQAHRSENFQNGNFGLDIPGGKWLGDNINCCWMGQYMWTTRLQIHSQYTGLMWSITTYKD